MPASPKDLTHCLHMTLAIRNTFVREQVALRSALSTQLMREPQFF